MMRRGLLIVLALALLLSSTPATAAGSTWDLSPLDWWSYLASLWSGDEAMAVTAHSETGDTLPVLDPDGLTATGLDLESTSGQTAEDGSGSDDGNTLPVLDPDG